MESTMDRDFDPSAEILVHDFDDERTLEEEEAMYPEDDSQAELSSLQKEQDMPLADILASYGIKAVPSTDGQGGRRYFINDASVVAAADEEEEDEESEETGGESDSNQSSLPHVYGSSSANASSLSNTTDANSSTASVPGRSKDGSGQRRMNLMRPVNGSDDEDEEEEEETDAEYMPDDKLPWKKVVNVGPQFQASVPSLVSEDAPNKRYHPNEDRLASCQWSPGKAREQDVVDYLKKARSLSDEVRKEMQTGKGSPESFSRKGSFPYHGSAAVQKDNEKALKMLMENKYNTRDALARWKAIVRKDQDHDLKLWSEEETRLFENGLLQYGKDFFKLHHFVVRTRSRAELVEYYYFWKKSLRHDIAVSRPGANHRLEKKKFALNPNTTTPDEHPALNPPPPPPPPVGSEMMDHIMDEQQQNAWPCPPTAASLSTAGLAAQFLLSGLVDVDDRDIPVAIMASPSSSPSMSAMNGRVLRQTTRTSGESANS